MRKLFKERKLFKGGNYMRKYGRFLCKGSIAAGILFDSPRTTESLDRIVVRTQSKWWPRASIFTTMIEVNFSSANSIISASLRPFLCMVFLIGLLTKKGFEMTVEMLNIHFIIV